MLLFAFAASDPQILRGEMLLRSCLSTEQLHNPKILTIHFSALLNESINHSKPLSFRRGVGGVGVRQAYAQRVGSSDGMTLLVTLCEDSSLIYYRSVRAPLCHLSTAAPKPDRASPCPSQRGYSPQTLNF